MRRSGGMCFVQWARTSAVWARHSANRDINLLSEISDKRFYYFWFFLRVFWAANPEPDLPADGFDGPKFGALRPFSFAFVANCLGGGAPLTFGIFWSFACFLSDMDFVVLPDSPLRLDCVANLFSLEGPEKRGSWDKFSIFDSSSGTSNFSNCWSCLNFAIASLAEDIYCSSLIWEFVPADYLFDDLMDLLKKSEKKME